MTLESILSQLWCHLSLIFGVLGNSLVIYATVKHKAIKLDKLSVWIIQNLAVSDLINSIIVLVPVIVSLYANDQWILGDAFCTTSMFYNNCSVVASAILINALSLNKMLRCLFPLRFMNTSKTQQRLVTIVTAVSVMIIPAFQFYKFTIKHEFIVKFSPSRCQCVSFKKSFNITGAPISALLLVSITNLLPCLSMCTLNTILVTYALKKSNRGVNIWNILIVVLVTASFLFSMLPYFVFILVNYDVDRSAIIVDRYRELKMRVIVFITFLQLWSNPIIYLVTNQNFKNYMMQLVVKRSNPDIRQHSRT